MNGGENGQQHSVERQSVGGAANDGKNGSKPEQERSIEVSVNNDLPNPNEH